MTQSGMSWTRCEMRMVRSAGVQEPQRPFWLRTQRTLTGRDAFGTSARYRTARRCALVCSSSSVRRLRCSRASRRSSIRSTRSPSRYADTVRRRRWLRRTSTTGLRPMPVHHRPPAHASRRLPIRRKGESLDRRPESPYCWPSAWKIPAEVILSTRRSPVVHALSTSAHTVTHRVIPNVWTARHAQEEQHRRVLTKHTSPTLVTRQTHGVDLLTLSTWDRSVTSRNG